MKRYLITGASRGIGRAIAVRLASPQTTLLLHGRDKEALTETSRLAEARRARTQILIGDLSITEQVAELIDRAGAEPLDLLVNNAGIAIAKPLESITLEDWERSISVNLTAPFRLIQGLVPHLNEYASIVNILSTASRTAFPGWSTYCMTKFGLDGFSQALREELRTQGIRVINLYPAATDTDIWEDVAGDWPRDKMMAPSEVAEALAFALERPPSVLVEEIRLGPQGGNL